MKRTKKAATRLDEVQLLRKQLGAVRRSDAELKRAADWLYAQNRLLELCAGGAPLLEVLNSQCLLIEHQLAGGMCSILLLDEQRRTLRAAAAPSLPIEYARALDGLTIGSCAGSCGTAAFLGAPMIVSDIATDPLWAHFRDLALRFGIRACWSIPFFSASGEVLGAFAISHHEPRRPTSQEQDLMKTAAHLAGLVTERARTEEALHRTNEDLEARVRERTASLVAKNAQLEETVTAWKRALEESASLARFPEENPHPILRIAEDGRIIYRNKACAPLLNTWGCQAGQGLPSHWHQHVLEVLRSGLPGHADVACGDRIFSLTFTPVRDSHYVNVYALDITDRKQAEEMLRTKTAQLEAITEGMTKFLETGNWREASARILRAALGQTQSEYGFLGVVVEGPVLRILAHEGVVWDSHVNREFYERAARTYEEVGYLEFTKFDNLFGRVITSGQVVIANEPGRDPRSGGLPPGHPPLRHFLGVPIRQGAEVVGMVGVANRPEGYTGLEQHALEILMQAAGVLYDSYRREQREAQLGEQLRQAQKLDAIGQLAGGIAHDFNNLLTAINGYSDMLLSDRDRDDPLRHALEQIQYAGERASSLTRQLLAFSRRQVLAPKVLDLNKVVRDMEKLLRRLIGEDLTLVTHQDPSLGYVKADPGQIEQVLMNLAVNARDAMGGGDQLTIETQNVDLDEAFARAHVPTEPGPYVRLAVSDTGCGMDADTQRRIFEPFFTTKPQGKGTGLGLSTVYGIVKQSGGYIWVSSEPGEGTAFDVYLPRVGEDVEPTPSTQAPTGALRGSETILLVDDEAVVRDLARAVLEAHGYTVLEAGNGTQALHLAKEHRGPIHLLLTDVVMPGLSGRDLAERLRAARPETKVLYMSGYDTQMTKQGEVESGTTLLQKPFRASALAGKVREVLWGGCARATTTWRG